MKAIAIIDPGYDSYDYERELFHQHGFSLEINESPRAQNDRRIDFARNAVGILVRGTLIDKEALSKLPGLKAIVRYGTGYDNVDIDSVKARGIRVCNVQGYGNHSVSDHALALMFACIRDLEGNRKDPFGVPSRKDMFEIHDKTLGIIGLGRIGSLFSKKASPLFKDTLACDPYKDAAYMRSHGASKTDLADLLRKCHVISIHCNLTEETRHLLNLSGFKQMANRPVIINTSRGPVIREADLLTALDKHMIHSAGIDVFEQEPPGEAQERLKVHPRIVTTTHVAWYSERSVRELQKRAAENMIALLSGKQVSDEL